jgi:DNA-binding transcriptional ArsR family regulator
MKATDVVAALGALAQPNRLEVFRLLVRRGPDGIPAGEIAEELDIAAPTLSFHLAQLRHAGLVQVRREGRSLIYAADIARMREVMRFLTDHCCADASRPAVIKKPERIRP